MPPMETPTAPGHVNKQRFETLIDAIFAIVMTFLVLEFKVPKIEHASTEALKASLLEMLPLVFCYFVSFFTIAVIWLDHHFLFRHVKYITKTYAYINFLFIVTVSALPFATGFAGEYIHNPLAVALFNGCILLMNLVFSWVYAYPKVKNIITEEGLQLLKKGEALPIIGMIIIIASVPLAYVNTIMAFGLSFLVLMLHMFKKVAV